MNGDLISVVIIIYNTEKYLSKCIESVLNQTYDNLDIVIVNDGSKDNSSSIVRSYDDSRINFIDRSINKGTMYTRQEGYNNSKGKYITFVDSDDFLEKNAIETMYNDIIKYNVDMVKCNFKKFKDGVYYKNSNPITKSIKIINRDFDSKLYNLFFKTIYLNSMCGNLIKKEKLDCINNINSSLIYAEDFLCNYYLFKNIKSLYIDSNELYIYRINNESITNHIDTKRLLIKLNNAVDCFTEIYNDLDQYFLKTDNNYKIILQERLINVFSNTLLSLVNKVRKKDFINIFNNSQSLLLKSNMMNKYVYSNYLNNNKLIKLNNKYLINNKSKKFYNNSKLILLLKKIKNIL